MHSLMRRRSAALALLLLAGASSATAQQAPAPGLGIVSGTVRNNAGGGIADAVIRVVGSERSALSLADGRFLLDSIPAGMRQIAVTRIGYLPARADLLIRPDSAIVLAITLVPDGRQLDAVVITARYRNRLGGFVLDETDAPMPGASVSLVGSDRTATADSLGAFVFGELPPGAYLLEARALGFERGRYPVQMRADLDRTVTLRLRTGPMALTRMDMHNAVVVAREAESRHSMRRRAGTAIITREELAVMGRVGLDIALGNSTARDLFRRAAPDSYCVLVDGIRPLSRGVMSLSEDHGRGGTGLGFAGEAKAPPSEGWLRSFFADEVEMVELYPKNTDDSFTLCSRFTWGSGCACSPSQINPPSVVIWMR